MAYKGFAGGGRIGHHASTTILQAQRPFDMYAGRLATVETTPGSATLYYSDGNSWSALGGSSSNTPYVGRCTVASTAVGTVPYVAWSLNSAGTSSVTVNSSTGVFTLGKTGKYVMTITGKVSGSAPSNSINGSLQLGSLSNVTYLGDASATQACIYYVDSNNNISGGGLAGTMYITASVDNGTFILNNVSTGTGSTSSSNIMVTILYLGT
jgi:hypothetical protein